MSREFLLPELAESVVEGEIVKWLVAEGDTVTEDQPVVEVMTDKVTVELPSPFAGVLERQLAKEGDVVAVHEAIALFSDGSDTGAAVPSPSEREPDAQTENVQAREERSIVESGTGPEEDDGESLSLFRASAESDKGPVFQVRRSSGGEGGEAARNGTAQNDAVQERATGPWGRVLAVPAARKLARELDINLSQVPGSGPNGRIRVDDVRGFAESASATPARAPARPPEDSLEERLPVRGLRRAISKRMMASHLQTVRTLHVDEADVSDLAAMRARLKPLAEARGVGLSYLPFIMKATVAALKAFPMINASLDEDAGEIVRKHYYNLGVAVATEAGLVVPVIKGVDRKSLLEIAGEVSALADKAREGKLAAEEVRGGTFSLTNIGSLGGLFSFPIINVPEAAILGVHSIKKRPVVLEDDSIVPRRMLYLSLSFDHRVIDGAEAAMFTSHLIGLLESPERLMLEG